MGETTTEPARDGQDAQHLHPSSLLFGLGSAARRLLIPGILVLLASRGNRADLWLMAMFVPAAVGTAIKFLSYRYRFGRDDIVIREGIVTRNERHIPYSRIQNIDLVQNPLHRLLGVAEVRLETASGEKPEAVMKVLSLQAVERMRQRVLGGRKGAGEAAGEEAAEAPPRTLVHLSTREVLLMGLLSNRGLILAAAAVGGLSQFAPDEIGDRIGEWIRRWTEAPPSLDGTVLADRWVYVALGAVALLLLLKLLSVVWIVLKYHGFRLTRRGEDLRAEYGLLTRVTATIPRRRIQVLSTHSGPLQRMLRRVSVQVETAGGRQGDEESHTDRLWLAPLLREARLDLLLAEALPGIDPETADWKAPEPRAHGRILRRGLLLGLLAVGLAWGSLGVWSLAAAPPAALLAFLNARLYLRHTRHALHGGAVLYRSGWWRRRTSTVRFEKIQTLSLRQSPFDRRARMAAVSVDTAGAGRIGHPVHVRYLAERTATDLHERLFREAGRTDFRW
jgi:putative membrane protein